jgi:hypothetical protein
VWLVNNDRYQHQASIAVLKIKRALLSKIMLYPSLRRSLSKIAHPERAAAVVGDDLCKPRFRAVQTVVRFTGALSLAKISFSPRLTRPVNDQIQWLADKFPTQRNKEVQMDISEHLSDEQGDDRRRAKRLAKITKG